MANDISPKLREKIQASFESNLASNKKASSLLEKINSGKATYKDAGNYAEQVGESLSGALRDNLTVNNLPDGTMYYNIAEKAIKPMYEQEYQLSSSAAATVQKSLNTKAGIGLNAKTAKLDEESLKSILDMYCAAEYDGPIQELVDTAIYFARQSVDETLKDNAEFQYQCGRQPRIIRRAGFGCCEWCAEVEGVYDYPNVPSEVYRRHDYCKCAVDYDPGSSDRKVQDVWDKNTWRTEEEAEKLEERKTYNLRRSYDSSGKKIKYNSSGNRYTTVDKERLKTLNL